MKSKLDKLDELQIKMSESYKELSNACRQLATGIEGLRAHLKAIPAVFHSK